MDAVKILGSLLSNNAMGSDVGGNILGNLLGGSKSGSGGGGDILGTLLGGRSRAGGGGLGALGGLLAAAARSQSGKQSSGGIGMLGELLGGGAGSGNLGGLGSLLGGGEASQQKKSGLGGLLGGLLGGGQQQSSGGAGDLLGSLLGGGSGGGSGADRLSGLVASAGQNAGGGELLGMLLGKGQAAEPPKEAQEEAETLIQAMCNAAKSDGQIDQAERDAILGRLGELDEQEVEYLREHLSSPLDVEGFIRNVPADMAEQVYAFSLMAIKLDSQKEAEYFGKLANGLKISGDTANEIHARLGQPEIFA